MSTKLTEHNQLIATRVPPGDKWTLVDDKKKIIRELVKSIPGVSANVGGLRDRIYEALGVESTFGQGAGLDFSVDSFSIED